MPDSKTVIGIAAITLSVIAMATSILVYYNTRSQAIHSFTIDAPYNIHVIVKPGESKTLSFVADTPGTFEYRCLYHPDIMKGELVVLP